MSNLIELADVGGVPLNGVPSPGITQSTRSGYVAMPINDFRGLVKSCHEGTYTISVLASLSAQYRVAVTGKSINSWWKKVDIMQVRWKEGRNVARGKCKKELVNRAVW